MPELLEAELYRSAMAASLGQRIASVEVDPPSYLRWGPADGAVAAAEIVGETVGGVTRHGKVVIVALESGRQLTVRFGMTGRVIVDGDAPIDALVYGPQEDDPRWDRVVIRFADGGSWRLSDPRKLGRMVVDGTVDDLGPDATAVDAAKLAHALRTRTALKSALMDQRRLAGLGNLLADDVLHRAGLSPLRPANSLVASEVERLVGAIAETLRILGERGGSHLGDLQPQRHRDGTCPRCGGLLERTVIGGRSAYWCPTEQR